MKKHQVAASATLAMVIAGGGTLASAACDPPTRAIQYLASHQSADGSIDESINETADYVLGAASDGIDPNTLTSTASLTAFDFFTADLAGPRKSLRDANVLGKLIQAVVAGHRNPRSFGGIDLLDTLRHGKTSGAAPQPYYDQATGRFLDAISSGQNQAFTQANGILAMAATADPAFNVPAHAVTTLKSLRSTSGATKGGWSSFGTFDSNDTAMALMALVASHDTPATDLTVFNDAFSFLRTQQDPASGGFIFSTQFPGPSDPVSDSFVIQTLVATGQDPAGGSWTNSAGNAPRDILLFQDPASGGFRFASGGKLQAFATSEALLGLRGAALPVTGAFTPGTTIPVVVCPVPTGSGVQAATTGAPGLPSSGRAGPLSGQPFSAAGLVLGFLGLAVVSAAVTAGRRQRARR